MLNSGYATEHWSSIVELLLPRTEESLVQTCLTIVPAADSVPVANDIEKLEITAQAINLTITQGEQSLAAAYWELGDTLLQLRPLYSRGEWEGNLARLGIEQTRAKRAIWFRRNYATLDQAEQVESPTKAFAARSRTQAQQRKKPAEPVFELDFASQPDEISEEEFLAFNDFATVCGSLERAMRVAESCCSICTEVAVNE